MFRFFSRLITYVLLPVFAIPLWIITWVAWTSGDGKFEPWNALVGAIISTMLFVASLLNEKATISIKLSERQRGFREKRWRQRIIQDVTDIWVGKTGVLGSSLQGVRRLSINLQFKPRVVHEEPPQIAHLSQDSLSSEHILEVYRSLKGDMLILGEPGSGKTIILLELTQKLLQIAKDSEDQPIPIVLNLSTWGQKHNDFEDWVTDELSIVYQLPKEDSATLIAGDFFQLMLDGLDEVDLHYRSSCVEAVKNFRKERPLTDVIVCSRTQDYESIGVPLEFSGAIVLQPLNDEQINEYFSGESLDIQAARSTLHHDPILRQMATSPLWLYIILSAYRGLSFADLHSLNSLEDRRHHLFYTYVQQTLDRRSKIEETSRKPQWSEKQIIAWLIWLATQMSKKSTIFHIERIQPTWLFPDKEKRLYGMILTTIIGFSYGLAWGGIIGLSYAGLAWGGLFGAAIGSLIGFSTEWVLGLNYSEFKRRSISDRSTELARRNAIRIGKVYAFISALSYFAFTTILIVILLLLGIINLSQILVLFLRSSLISFAFGSFLGLTITLHGPHSEIRLAEIASWSWQQARKTKKDKKTFWYSPYFGLPKLIYAGFVYSETDRELRPNQGVWRSARNALRFGLVSGFFVALPFILIDWLLLLLADTTTETVNLLGDGLLIALFSWLRISLFFWFIFGGMGVVKHFVVRLILYRKKNLPWRLVEFLEFSASNIILQKVGGGYKFIHETILEYFTSLATEETSIPVPEQIGERHSFFRNFLERTSAPVASLIHYITSRVLIDHAKNPISIDATDNELIQHEIKKRATQNWQVISRENSTVEFGKSRKLNRKFLSVGAVLLMPGLVASAILGGFSITEPSFKWSDASYLFQCFLSPGLLVCGLVILDYVLQRKRRVTVTAEELREERLKCICANCNYENELSSTRCKVCGISLRKAYQDKQRAEGNDLEQETISSSAKQKPDTLGKFVERGFIYFIDCLVLLGIVVSMFFLLLIIEASGATPIVELNEMIQFIIFLGGLVFLYIAYFFTFEWLYGATPAKLFFQKRVVTIGGEICSPKSVFIRVVFGVIEALLFGIPSYFSMKPPHYQRVGDKWAGAIVVSSKSSVIKSRNPWWRFFLAAGLFSLIMLLLLTIFTLFIV